MISVYKFSEKIFNEVHSISEAVFSGIWLGILSKEQIHKIDELYYNDEKMYFSEDHNTDGLLNWEKLVITKYFQNRNNLLLLAAGAGREVFGLKELSFEVDAYECNPALVKFGNELLEKHSISDTISLIARDECPDSEKLYDGAILGWGSYTLVQGRENRISLLKKIKKTVKPQSPVLVSFYVRSWHKKHFSIASKISNIFRFILSREYTDSGDFLVPDFVHYFTKKEIAQELSEAGFELAFFAKHPYGHAVGINHG